MLRLTFTAFFEENIINVTLLVKFDCINFSVLAVDKYILEFFRDRMYILNVWKKR